MNMYRLLSLGIVCIALTPISPVLHAELVIFKRVHDDINAPTHTLQHQVWVVDAPQLILGPLNQRGQQIFEPQAQQAFIDALPEQINLPQLRAYWLISVVAQAKMQRYGIERLPAALQIDRDGTVVRRVYGITAIEQALARERPDSDRRVSKDWPKTQMR